MTSVFDRPILTARLYAGFNAQAFLAGLLALTKSPLLSPNELLKSRFPDIDTTLTLDPVSINHIAGVTARFTLPHEHVHRTIGDVKAIYDASQLSDAAKSHAMSIWSVLTHAEAQVHGAPVEHVHFHEVGRMANILAIGLIGELIASLNPQAIIASPIPLGDGVVQCTHGAVPNPAPSLFAMLDRVPVRPFEGQGEAITPTGLAVLLGLNASFGPWPNMQVEKHATVFWPGPAFDHVPNGTLFALGRPL